MPVPDSRASAFRGSHFNPNLLRQSQSGTSHGPVAPNEVITRLRAELDRIARVTRPVPTGELVQRKAGDPHSKFAWARLWRQWAIEDLTEQVAMMANAYVIYRGDVFKYRLFMDRQGRHMLAVRPQDAAARFRYQKLRHDSELTELYSPYARLSFNPRG